MAQKRAEGDGPESQHIRAALMNDFFVENEVGIASRGPCSCSSATADKKVDQ